MSVPRMPSNGEKSVVIALLQSRPETRHLVSGLSDLLVADVADGGMGSLSLVPKGVESGGRSFGKQIASGEFLDTDGVPVSLALNVDNENRLYELDVWKVDFTPLCRWPAPDEIKIISTSTQRPQGGERV